MWWWAPTNAHHCAITLTTFLYCILQCTNNATSSCSKAINHKLKFSIITQKFPRGPFKFQEISRISRRVFKFQEISRISRSCRHPETQLKCLHTCRCILILLLTVSPTVYPQFSALTSCLQASATCQSGARLPTGSRMGQMAGGGGSRWDWDIGL